MRCGSIGKKCTKVSAKRSARYAKKRKTHLSTSMSAEAEEGIERKLTDDLKQWKQGSEGSI